MARKRDPRRDEAYQIWKKSNGSIKLKDIAERLEVADTQIRKWKSLDKWDESKGNVTNSKRNVTKQGLSEKMIIVSEDLNSKQQQFCLHYIRHYNATKAYQEAYECDYRTAHANAYRMMAVDGIQNEIRRLKAEMQSELFVDAGDIAREYMKMAFADISDFVDFGIEYHEQTDESGELVRDEETGEIVTKPYSFVRLKNKEEVDGTMIQEVKLGRDGVSLKLYDKQKAMQCC